MTVQQYGIADSIWEAYWHQLQATASWIPWLDWRLDSWFFVPGIPSWEITCNVSPSLLKSDTDLTQIFTVSIQIGNFYRFRILIDIITIIQALQHLWGNKHACKEPQEDKEHVHSMYMVLKPKTIFMGNIVQNICSQHAHQLSKKHARLTKHSQILSAVTFLIATHNPHTAIHCPQHCFQGKELHKDEISRKFKSLFKHHPILFIWSQKKIPKSIKFRSTIRSAKLGDSAGEHVGHNEKVQTGPSTQKPHR